MTRNSDRRKAELTADLVMIGEITKPHGIRGEVKVYSYSEKPENFKHYKNVVLQEPTESGTKIYEVIKSRVQGKLVILQLESVATREAAEALQGSKVWLSKDDFPKLDSDEYYWHQLEGLLVLTEAGQELGRVSKLFSTSAHDIMVVSGAGDEYLIPLEGAIIRNIDEQGGKIIISPPPGLLEINK
ncbi:MAG: 16S rRNA processing protein RimM [Deltaproteobacteria bacterium]|nr:MAG: 16S rRNA processing protein RimM [Deltaproteobacteria bacterium]